MASMRDRSASPFGVFGLPDRAAPGWKPNPDNFKPGMGPGGSANTFNAQDPWGWLGGQSQGNFGDIFNVLMGQAGQAGMFDPRGNQALLGALKQDAQRQSLGRTRSALNFAKNNAVDPSAYGFTALMAQLGGQSDLADALLNARTQSGLQSQNFYQNLLNMGLQNNWGWQSADQQYKIQQGLAQAKPKGGGLGGLLGQIGGMAVGSIPGLGGLFGGGGGFNAGASPSSTAMGGMNPYFGKP